MLSNLIWIFLGFWISSLAMILGNAIFLGVNIRGWFRWTEEARRQEELRRDAA
jgi:nicotinamide riboside transporter PnuC